MSTLCPLTCRPSLKYSAGALVTSRCVRRATCVSASTSYRRNAPRLAPRSSPRNGSAASRLASSGTNVSDTTCRQKSNRSVSGMSSVRNTSGMSALRADPDVRVANNCADHVQQLPAACAHGQALFSHGQDGRRWPPKNGAIDKERAENPVDTFFDRPLNRRGFLAAMGAAGVATAAGCTGGLQDTSNGGGQTIKIGYVSPKTGPLAVFGESNEYVLGTIRKAIGSGLDIGGKKYPVEIIE